MSSKKSNEESTPVKGDESKAAAKAKAGRAKKKVSKKKAAASRSAKKPSGEQRAAEISAATSVAASAVPAETQAAKGLPAESSSTGMLRLALIASLLALAIAAYAAYQFTLSSQVNSARVAGLEDRIAFIVAEQQSQKTAFERLDNSSVSDIKRIDSFLAEIESGLAAVKGKADASIDDIKANLGAAVARWKLDELHSLLTRVNRVYQLSGDQAQAVAGLRLAQASLATIDDPVLEGVSAALEEDILSVQSDRSVDTRALYNRMAGMSAMVPELVLTEDSQRAEQLAQAAVDQGESEAPADPDSDSGILAAGKTLFSDIGNLVKHKDLDAPLQPSLDNAARFVVYESLQLNIQAAMAALLRRDNEAYHAQLGLARDTLDLYFDKELQGTVNMLDQLEVLQSYDITLNAQAISRALQELDRVMILEN